MKFEFSAGGVVFKKVDGKIMILLAQHGQHHGWVFPKGIIGDTKEKESKEETAMREVEEETGVVAKLLDPLEPVEYWYQWEDEKHKKTVYYFIMEYISEDVTKKDDEMENVEWLPLEDVATRLTYPSDKKVWGEAKEIIEKLS
jgi:8-oxo-dGTP pyrophosphatase MutT (NUDIX family)